MFEGHSHMSGPSCHHSSSVAIKAPQYFILTDGKKLDLLFMITVKFRLAHDQALAQIG